VTPDEGLALGFDFGGTKCAVAVGTADGAVLAETHVPTAGFSRPDALVAAVLDRGRELAARHRIRAVGVASMGITREDGVALAPNVHGWSSLHLPETIQRFFPTLPVRIANDVKAAHRAELRWGALQHQDSSAYLNLGTGIALSFAMAGRVVAGEHGAFGELAYAWRDGEAGIGTGRAPLEERLGGGALDRELRRRFQTDSLQAAFSVRESRPDLAGFLYERFAELGWWIGQALVILDVGVLAVGGGVSRHLDVFGPWWQAEWARHLPFPPALIPARFLDRAGVMGALSLAWEDDR
jgi:glucokinase